MAISKAMALVLSMAISLAIVIAMAMALAMTLALAVARMNLAKRLSLVLLSQDLFLRLYFLCPTLPAVS